MLTDQHCHVFVQTNTAIFLVHFKVCMSKVSDKTDKLMLNYRNLFSDLLFIQVQCTF